MQLTRRQFLTATATAALAGLTGGCGVSEQPTAPGPFVQNADGSFISGGIRFPLKEKQSYTFFVCPDEMTLEVNSGNLANSTFWQELERRTNVHFDLVYAPHGMDTDAYLEQLIHHYLPDVIMGRQTFAKGVPGEKRYYLTLTDLLPTAAPEYLQCLRESEAFGQKRTEQWLYNISSNDPVPYAGFVMRGDWLRELGLSVPETYDEWETVLTAFRDEKGCAAPLAVTRDTYLCLGAGCGANCDLNGNMYYADGNRLQHALLARPDACRDFLARMQRWYAMGLLAPECLTASGPSPDRHYLNTGASGAAFAMYTEIDSRYRPVYEAGGRLVGVPWPVPEKGRALRYNPALQLEKNYPAALLSAECPRPEVLLGLFNYLYTRPGFLLANYGLEGEQYVLDSAGEPHFLPPADSISAVLRKNTLPPSWGPALIDQQRQLAVCSEDARRAVEAWEGGREELPPNVELSGEDMDRYREYYLPLRSRINEVCEQLVIGAMSFDRWNSFLNELNDMRLPLCVTLLRDALREQ